MNAKKYLDMLQIDWIVNCVKEYCYVVDPKRENYVKDIFPLKFFERDGTYYIQVNKEIHCFDIDVDKTSTSNYAKCLKLIFEAVEMIEHLQSNNGLKKVSIVKNKNGGQRYINYTLSSRSFQYMLMIYNYYKIE